MILSGPLRSVLDAFVAASTIGRRYRAGLYPGWVASATACGAVLLRLYLFGVVIGMGSAIIFVASVLTHVPSAHVVSILIATLALVTTAALFVAVTRQELTLGRLVQLLPTLRTPDSLADYLKKALQDESAELLFRELGSPEGQLIDLYGRPRSLEREIADGRFWKDVAAGNGDRIAVLVGDPRLRNDQVTVSALYRLISILAENARLQAVPRVRIAQVTATQTAKDLAYDEARQSFQRDLHDGLQQTIAAARITLSILREECADAARSTLFSTLSGSLDLALEQVHSLHRGARPPELRFGLKPALERTVSGLRLPADCRVTEADLGVLTLPAYYLAREALMNVHKHADASRVNLHIDTDGTTVEISVTDDGVGGLAPGDRGGIAGMKKRTEELGGRLSIVSYPGAGTSVKVSLPCVLS